VKDRHSAVPDWKEKIMKQYLLSVHMVEGQAPPAPEEIENRYGSVDDFNKELQDKGAWVFAGGLHPPDTATVVSMQGGEVLTTDGPFAETKEQLGGYYIVEAENLDEAVAIAARIPGARTGSIEVRPVMKMHM
jgi:hypothetical protein